MATLNYNAAAILTDNTPTLGVCEECGSLGAKEQFELQYPKEMSGPPRRISNGWLCLSCEIELDDVDETGFDDPFDSAYDRLSAAEQYEHDEREVFNDRYNAWRNEY